MQDELLKTFDTMSCGLYIVTSAYRNRPAGCTCTWVTRASFSPPLIAIHLQPGKHTFQTVSQGKRFCVNVLGEEDLKLARQFAFTSGIKQNKFTGVVWRKGVSGSPILASALSYIDCRVQRVAANGDHQLVLGEVVDAAVQSAAQPLIYDPETFYVGDLRREEASGGEA